MVVEPLSRLGKRKDKG